MIYSETERQALIFLLTYSEIEELSVYHYQNFLDVSKGTILADIKKVRHQLATSDSSFREKLACPPLTTKVGHLCFILLAQSASNEPIRKNA